jgi:predicted dinucleotide-binding enzyme
MHAVGDDLNIGIIGAGNIAGTVGSLWAKSGHAVRFGTRHPTELEPLLARAGRLASAGTPAEAAHFGEAVFCSVPFGVWPTLAPELAPFLSGKVVLDSANPYPDRDGAFALETIAAGEGAGVPIARLLPSVRLVRAFNSVYFKTLQTEAHRAGDQLGIPLAGDDTAALELASRLVRDAGFEPVIVGPLVSARSFDAGTPVYNTGMSGAQLARALGVVRSSAISELHT